MFNARWGDSSASSSKPSNALSSGNVGYTVIQPDEGGPFQVVQPQYLPTSSRNAEVSNRSSNKNTQSSTNRRLTGTTTTTGRSVTDRMDPKSRAAYNNTLDTLLGGGSEYQRQGMAELTSLLNRSRMAEEGYSMDAARQQAQQSTPMYARQLREEIMPTILNAQEGAGLSGDALTALLAQDQTARVAERAAAAELEAIVAFGNLLQGQMGITGGAASELANDPIQAALQQLLQIGKGAYEDTRSSELVNQNLLEQTDMNTMERVNELLEGSSGTETTYQGFGGNEGGGGNNTRRGFSGSTASGGSGRDQNESMALLLSALGPFQNLQDYYDYSTPTADDAFMTGRRNSGRNIKQLAGTLGVRL